MMEKLEKEGPDPRKATRSRGSDAVTVVGRTDDLRIAGVRALIPPQLLLEELPMDAAALATVTNARQAIHRVLHGADDRLLAVVGPGPTHHSPPAPRSPARLAK